MKRRRQPQVTKADFQGFEYRMLQAKADERRQAHGDAGPVIFNDDLLRTLLVVEHQGELYLCPRWPGGWSSRQRLTMTPAARQQRLTPARDSTPAWLAID